MISDNYLSDTDLENVSYEDGIKAINNYFDNMDSQVENQEADSGSEQTQGVESTSAEPQQEMNDNQDYSKLFQPFKAGGREVQIRNLDEAISLMQKGVDYTQKQQALKPRLNDMRALEQQGMLGENLNYAIDLYNGKPEAIAKLIKDKQIDINSLIPQNEFGEPKEDTPYVPTEYRLSDLQLQLQDVIDELKSTNSLEKVDTAIKGWDKASKEEFSKDPQKLIALNEHIESGFYDTVMKELDHARLVGNPLIRGKNDFEAYTLIGEAMYQNMLYQQHQQPVPHQQQPVVQPQYQPQHQQNYQPTQRIQERKASVAPVRSAPQSRGWENFDPLAMSDEEFSKIDIKQLFKGV